MDISCTSSLPLHHSQELGMCVEDIEGCEVQLHGRGSTCSSSPYVISRIQPKCFILAPLRLSLPIPTRYDDVLHASCMRCKHCLAKVTRERRSRTADLELVPVRSAMSRSPDGREYCHASIGYRLICL